MSAVRLRFAPSPTGVLHVGGARTALFNYLYARSHGGVFVLRVEDTDKKRSSGRNEEQVKEALKWLGINWDEGPGVGGDHGPYRQSERLALYDQCFDTLLSEEKVYPCFCSDLDLGRMKARSEATKQPFVYDGRCKNLPKSVVAERLKSGVPFSYRFKVEPKILVFDDMVKGKVKFDSALIGDFIVRKSDGFPTYNFACVVDDVSMNITKILRGDDHISNTPRQLLLYEAFGKPPPEFGHLSMILGPGREKLSKRDGATDVLDFRRVGYYADPLANHLALLGWSPEDGVEVIPKATLLRSFKGAKFSPSPAIFDRSKLDFLNGHYLRQLPEEKLYEDLAPYVRAAGHDPKDDRVRRVVLAMQRYCKKLSDIGDHINPFLVRGVEVSDDLRLHVEDEQAQKLLLLAADFFGKQPKQAFVSMEEFKELSKKAREELQLKGKVFFLPIRIQLTGQESGVEMETVLRLLPREEVVRRLRGGEKRTSS